MAEPSAFETLVLELDPEERGALLEKLVRVSSVSREPLAPMRDLPEDTVDYSEILAGMGFFSRLFISIRSMLSGKPKEYLVREKLLRQIARGVESSCPGILDYRRKVLLEPFHTELLSLRQAARYFYELLDRTLEKSRGPFFAFLGSLQFERVHEELTSDADPYVFSQRNALAEESDVRTAVNAAFETALSHIDEDSRRSMLRDVRNLHALKRLSAFLFDRLAGQFRPAQNGRKELSVLAVSEQLSELAEVLAALETPSPRLMESMLAFSMGEDMGHEGFDLDAAVKKELGQAEKALQAIRSFNVRVPMASLVKLANEDPKQQLAPVPGGEDWYAIYKSYWKDRIDRRWQRWSAERRLAQLEADIRYLVGDAPPTALEHLSAEGSETVPPVRYTQALRFLEAFYHHVFLNEINRVLKVVLLEGEFYKRDNRVDFTDAYNAILQTGDALKTLDRRVATEGELGSAYAHAKSELVPVQIKRRKIESCIQAADTEAEALIKRACDAMGRMQLIIRAILAGEARGQYDSLSNLSRLQGKANKDFQKNLEVAKDRFEKAVFLLSELSRAALGGEQARP